MAISVTINNKTFNIPVAGQDPGWGEDTTSWILEINSLVSSLFGAGDIVESSSNIANNQTTSQNVIALLFDPSIIRAAVVEYSVYRVSDETPSGTVETGTLELVYDNNASGGSKWQLAREFVGDANISIDITDAGQLTYQSGNIGSTNYSGVIKFKARALSQ